MGIATLLPVLGFALLLARRLGTTHSTAMLYTVAAIILTLYAGGIAGALWWTAAAIHLFGLVVLGRELLVISRNRERWQVPLPLAALLVCTALFWLVHGSSQYLYYDEFSHWGVYIKEMLYLDGFWGADTNSMHPRYPPAAPLWQYFFNVIGEPSEGTAYVAQFVLLLTPLLVLWERIAWRQAQWMLLVVALCLLALTNFGLGVSSLYVDHVIGTWFVGTILCCTLEAPALRRGLLFCLPVAVIALLKESSLAFALAVAGLCGLLACCCIWKDSGRSGRAVAGGAVTAVAITLPAMLCLGVWQWHLDRIGAPEDLEAVGGIVSGLRGQGETLDAVEGQEITRRFLEVFSSQQLGNDGVSRQFNAFSYALTDLYSESHRLSTLGLFVAFAIWWAGLQVCVLRGFDRWRWGVVAAGIGFTAASYLLVLYLSYRYAMGEYGLDLSSYTRYVHTVALPMLIVAFAPLLPAFRGAGAGPAVTIAERRAPVASLIAAIGCVAVYYFEPPYLRPIYEPNDVVGLRQELEPAAAAVSAAAGRSRVWVYLPTDLPNGFVGRLVQFLLAPTPAHVEREADYFARGTDQVLADWTGYGFVWIAAELDAATAGRFVEVSGQALTERLFAVVVDAAGRIRLRPVPDKA